MDASCKIAKRLFQPWNLLFLLCDLLSMVGDSTLKPANFAPALGVQRLPLLFRLVQALVRCVQCRFALLEVSFPLAELVAPFTQKFAVDAQVTARELGLSIRP